MWLNENEFEEALASYWENEDDQDALHLRYEKVTSKNPIFSARRSVADLFKRIHDGVSTHEDHGKITFR